MSKANGVIELAVPQNSVTRHETLVLGGFKCPNCCAGKVRKYGEVPRQDRFVECSFCKGVGRLNAHVKIEWLPAAK